METRPSLKRARTDEDSPMETAYSGAIVLRTGDASASVGQPGTEISELIARPIERLSLTISPLFLQSLREAGELGFRKPYDRRIPTIRYYEISPTALRKAMIYSLSNFYLFKLVESGQLTLTQAQTEATAITTLTVDVCMSALYAKLRNIHRTHGKYASRYTAPSRYTKDIEIPLPFANAICNLGTFSTRSTLIRYVCVPNFPEGTKYEGRSQDELDLAQYMAIIPYLKQVGIPVKSVDPHDKNGSPWWTYKVEKIENVFDFRCIFPALHYSEHSAICAALYLILNDDGTVDPILKHLDDDGNYQVRLQSIESGFQIRAFAALCGAPSEEWNSYANVD